MKSVLMFSGLLVFLMGGRPACVQPQTKHSPTSRYPTYEGRVMCGYQGWFRAEGDGSGEGWTHYSERGPLTAANLHSDFWPDVADYEKSYPTALTNRDGSAARVFSSWDQSTTDLGTRASPFSSAQIARQKVSACAITKGCQRIITCG